MQVQILGFQMVDFTTKKGDVIRGSNLFVGWEDENVTGMHTEKFFVKDGIELPKDTKINDSVDLSFNMHGKVEAIYPVK